MSNYILLTRLAILLSLLFSALSCAPLRQHQQESRVNASEHISSPYVILVSIDGYRFDYTNIYNPPKLKQLRFEAASAGALLSVYPSKTFTNHYSIVTGLFAENHGIIANNFFDPLKNLEFSLSDRLSVQDGSWYDGTPIWVAAEKQGMLAANYFWPGSEANIQGVRPTYFINYNSKVPLNERVEQVKSWLDLPPEKRPHFITLYFSDVDSAGHDFGPLSDEVKEAVFRVDHAITRLIEQAESTHLPINIIILSDHGMQNMNLKDIEYLDEYTDLSSARVLGDGIQVSLYFKDTHKIAKVYGDLKSKGKHFQIFKRGEIPERYHYSKNPRCGDLIIVTKAPYFVGVHNKPVTMSLGAHGYDPDTTQSMAGIFYAQGPNIKKNIQIPNFRNIHIYPLIMKILGLKISNPIDGDEKVLSLIYLENSH